MFKITVCVTKLELLNEIRTKGKFEITVCIAKLELLNDGKENTMNIFHIFISVLIKYSFDIF